MQLAGGITEPRQNQNLGHERPGTFFLAGCERAFDKIHEPHAPAQLQTQPGTPERPLPFHGDAVQINFHPLWLDISEQTALSDGCRSRGLLLKAESSRRIHLTEIGHYALPWTARGTITLDQSPITMALAILLPIAATQVHDSILRIATVFAIGLVFTTRAFKRITSHTTIRLRCKQECYGIPRPKLRKECVQKIFTRCKAAEDELAYSSTDFCVAARPHCKSKRGYWGRPIRRNRSWKCGSDRTNSNSGALFINTARLPSLSRKDCFNHLRAPCL